MTMPSMVTPDIEAQTFKDVLREPVTQLTRDLFEYLNRHASQHAELANVIPIV